MASLRITIHLCTRLLLSFTLSGCTTGDAGDSEAGLALEDLTQGLSPSRLSVQMTLPYYGLMTSCCTGAATT